jgi:hypothetical protein
MHFQQRIISSFYYFICAGFQSWKQTKVFSHKLLFFVGVPMWGLKWNLQNQSSRTSFKSKIKVHYFYHCRWKPVPSSHCIFSLLIARLLFFTVFSVPSFLWKVASFFFSFSFFPFLCFWVYSSLNKKYQIGWMCTLSVWKFLKIQSQETRYGKGLVTSLWVELLADQKCLLTLYHSFSVLSKESLNSMLIAKSLVSW